MENSLSGPAVSGVVVTRSLDPLGATRPHIELYVRWLQEAPIPTLDGIASHVGGRGLLPDLCDRRRARAFASRVRPAPNVPAESPILGLTDLQFEALLTNAKHSTNRCDFALVTMLGLLGLRIFEATGSNIEDLGEEHGHPVLRVHGKGRPGRARPPRTRRGPRHRTSHRHAAPRRSDPADLRRLHGLRHLTAHPLVRGQSTPYSTARAAGIRFTP
jgi:integrase